MMGVLRAFVVVFALAVAAVACFCSPAAAASCPTATYLDYGHLAYAEVAVPAGVQLSVGHPVGSGALDQATSADGCKRARHTVGVLSIGSIDPQVAVAVSGRPGSAFVIGQRCAGFTGSAYWECLTQPLVWRGVQYTATSYPSQPAPARTLALGPALGSASYHGRSVTIRRIDGVDPALAVGISGQPSVAWLSPRTCPYGGFSNTPQDDNLLRCLHSPVWFTFDPPGNQVGSAVVARADRPVRTAVAGAAISLAPLSISADYVPANPKLVPVGHVSGQFNLTLPDVPAGLYEAVVSCPQCSAGGAGGSDLYPAGSILISSKPSGSTVIQIINYVLIVAVLAALTLGFRARRRRGAQGLGRPASDLGRMLGGILLGPGPAGSSRRARSWSEDAAARDGGKEAAGTPDGRASNRPAARPASAQAKRRGRAARGGRQGKGGGRGRR
jgi:hypothetical protein